MSRIVSVLPSDFDIFSDPRLTNPLWSQDRTNGRAVAASDWGADYARYEQIAVAVGVDPVSKGIVLAGLAEAP